LGAILQLRPDNDLNARSPYNRQIASIRAPESAGAGRERKAEKTMAGILGLNLRQEFKGKRLKGTAIELSNESITGATQIAAAQFLEIAYPTMACARNDKLFSDGSDLAQLAKEIRYVVGGT
jgi:hypothetical protein